MKKYRVAGDRSYQGHDPGETFAADLSEAEEERALSRGSIEVVGKTSSVTDGRSVPVVEPEDSPPRGGGLFGRKAEESEEVRDGQGNS